MNSEIERLSFPDAPAPQGAYSPAVRAGDYIFISGQGSIDPLTNQFSFGDIRHETDIVLSNIRKILEGCGSSMSEVINCSVFLADANDFAEMNKIYATFWEPGHYPARTTVQAVLVEPDMKIEISCTAYSPRRRS
jgi:2-iminobutanoate/2-iminopropanoate deaminase